MLFAFFHELGHLFAGIFLGFRPKSLSINPVGLCIAFHVEVDDYNEKIGKGNILALKKLIIALMGPAVNFFIVIIFMLFDLKFFNIRREWVIYSNILIGLFNLIPIYPLDGGRVLKSLLHIIVGLQKSYEYINVISNVCVIVLTFFSSIMVFYLKNVSVVVIIGYLWCLVIRENKMMNWKRSLERNLGRFSFPTL